MQSSPIPDSCISLTILQFRILRFVYQASRQHPQTKIVLDVRRSDWEVLSAYRLLSRRIVQLPIGHCVEYRLSEAGHQLMKSLEV